MKIKRGFVKRKIAGKIVVVPTGKENYNKKIIITLNETASEIWDYIKNGKTAEDIAKCLVSVYEIDYENALKTVNDFIAELKENDFLDE